MNSTLKNTVVITGQLDLAKINARFIHISINMRYWQNYWQQHYGNRALKQKQRWEKHMDDLLTELGITDHINSNAIMQVRE